jgi:hypothetical protein
MDIWVIGWEGVGSIHLAQDRHFVNTVMNFRILLKSEMFLTS